MIVFLTQDLMFSSRASGAAERLGVELVAVATAAAALEKCEAEPVRLVLIDLTLPGLDLATLAAQLKASPSTPKLCAYAPHVHENRLDAARQAGCDQVLTRGQFNAQLDAILTSEG